MTEDRNAAKTTAAPAAAIRRRCCADHRDADRPATSGRGAPAATSTSTTRAGTTHTRWWVHEIGLTSAAARPVIVTPTRSSPARKACTARHSATPSTVRASTAHTTRLGWPGSARRASSPSRDWFDVLSSRPTRSVCHSVLVQNCHVVRGSTAALTSAAPAKVPAATDAARHRRVSTR